MLVARPLQTDGLFFLRPIPEEFPAQLPDLLNGSGFGLIGRAACAQRLIHQVRNGMEAGQDVWAACHPLFQRARLSPYRCVFIVHEPLQIYKTPPRSQAYFTGTR